MKAFLVTVIVIEAILLTNADLSDEQKEKIIANGKACVADTGVDRELIVKARQGTFTEDAKLKAFTFCMSKKLGFQNDAGEIQKDVVVQKLGGALNSPDAASKLADKCLIVKGSNEDTAFQSFKCYYENTPIHLTVF